MAQDGSSVKKALGDVESMYLTKSSLTGNPKRASLTEGAITSAHFSAPYFLWMYSVPLSSPGTPLIRNTVSGSV